ncbi:hypothetical protein [Kibdelosporangium aridum]|uniref:hypothetical protein n=1 Tax=Kibdelosporangium aridum TaxID=2030 RepID=UPI0035EC09FF
MKEISRVVVQDACAWTLAWIGGDLFDVSDRFRRIPLDGSPCPEGGERYDDNLDSVVVSPKGDVFALVNTIGTEALLIAPDGSVIRELSRFDNDADLYRYPLALLTMPNGRTGVVHCPEDSGQLDIEDALTGDRLALPEGQLDGDFYHSRLAVSADGHYLLSAGWVWMPFDGLAIYDLRRVWDQRGGLAGDGDVAQVRDFSSLEVEGACFVGDSVMIGSDKGLWLWSLTSKEFVWHREFPHPLGDLVALREGVLSLYEHPRLHDVGTGDVLAEWPELATGEAKSSLVGDGWFSGPATIAVDPVNSRFAHTDGSTVSVIQLV